MKQLAKYEIVTVNGGMNPNREDDYNKRLIAATAGIIAATVTGIVTWGASAPVSGGLALAFGGWVYNMLTGTTSNHPNILHH